MEINISVRGMVEFLFRSGDIDNTRVGGGTDAMLEGGRIHRLIQKRSGIEYEAEVPLTYVYDFGEYSLKLDGRADGVITHDKIVTIDEIKGTYRDINKLENPRPEHLAQAKCYAFIYLTQNNLPEIRVRMTYCNIETEEIRYFHETFSANQITEWFEDVMKAYKKWTDYSIEWSKKRRESIEGLKFPYEYREGQLDLMEGVYRTIYSGRKLFIQAPTGVGKTLATIYPSVMSFLKHDDEKIFYLTAKTITASVATGAFEILRDSGLRFKSVQLTAKDKICLNETCECNPFACEYAKGHMDRVNDALYDMLVSEEDLRRETIETYARKYKVCPFELSLDASLFADGIICDYNYLFDPHVYLKRFFQEGAKKNYVFLIDEAHNLVDRGRDMYSAVLTKEDFLLVKRGLKDGTLPESDRHVKRLIKWLDKCNGELLTQKKNFNYDNELQEMHGIEINAFISYLENLYQAFNSYMDEYINTPKSPELLQLYFDVAHFLQMYEEMDENYEIYRDLSDDMRFSIKLFCVDPSAKLKKCMDRGRSSILFSATFLPIQYYKKLLGGEPTDYEMYAHSIFDPMNRGVYYATDVNTLYTNRNEQLYQKISSYIRRITECKTGNYMVFFPSHQFLSKVLYYFEMDELPQMTNTEIVSQSSIMREEEREAFLEQFSDNQYQDNTDLMFDDIIQMDVEVEEISEDYSSSKTLIGFCVMGGIFSEGIDLKGDALIGSIIVGTGIPQVCTERDILRNFFEESGFDYAYRFPGMNKVLQAAGRVIRTETDRGIVVLLDNRFSSPNYRMLFPREWANVTQVNIDNITENISRFW